MIERFTSKYTTAPNKMLTLRELTLISFMFLKWILIDLSDAINGFRKTAKPKYSLMHSEVAAQNVVFTLFFKQSAITREIPYICSLLACVAGLSPNTSSQGIQPVINVLVSF